MAAIRSISLGDDISPGSTEWLLDSGASEHMCNDSSLFTNLKRVNHRINVANGSSMNCTATGRVPFSIGNLNFHFDNVLLCPSLRSNLISVSSLVDHGFKLNFLPKSCSVFDPNDKLILTAVRKGSLYSFMMNSKGNVPLTTDFTSQNLVLDTSRLVYALNTSPSNYVSSPSSSLESSLYHWHLRYNHLHPGALQHLNRHSMVTGLPDFASIIMPDCVACIQGKSKRLPFPKHSSSIVSAVGDLVHTDLCGPINPQSRSGFRYFITFTDHFSRYVWIYPLKQKSEALSKFKHLDCFLLNNYKTHVKTLRSDNGGEYRNSSFASYCSENGISQEFTVPYSPSQNGVAERLNLTLMNMVRAMLIYSGLPRSYWLEALSCAVYTKNRSPSAALPFHKTPFQIFTGRVPDASSLHIFGEPAFAQINAPNQKLSPRSTQFVFVGYSLESKGFRLLDPSTGKVIISRDVTFLKTPPSPESTDTSIRSNIIEIADNEFTLLSDHSKSICH